MSGDITKHDQINISVEIGEVFVFKSCGHWREASWPRWPVLCIQQKRHNYFHWGRLPCCPLPGCPVVTPRKGCQPPEKGGGGDWTISIWRSSPGLPCLEAPPLSLPVPPLHSCPSFLSVSFLPTGSWGVQSLCQISRSFTPSLLPSPPVSSSLAGSKGTVRGPSEVPHVLASKQYSKVAHKNIVS